MPRCACRRLAAVLLVLLLPMGGLAGPAEDRAADGRPLTIGWAAWASNEITAHIAARVLRERMDVPVELVNLDVVPMYRGVAAGEIDAMLAGWLPTGHAEYIDALHERLENLGVLYGEARLGWVVPDYVPVERVRAIGDLAQPQVRERFGGRIHGIEPGAGMTGLSRRAIEVYGLSSEYRLRVASSAAMTAALGRAIARREWIVVNGWTPHWMWSEWDLRYLEDPRGVFGEQQRVHVFARSGLARERPDVAAALARMWFPQEELDLALRRAREEGFERAAGWYLAAYPQRVRYWATGRVSGEGD